MDPAQLPANGDAAAARAARIPRVAAARAHLGAVGADRATAGPVLPLKTLCWQIATGKCHQC